MHCGCLINIFCLGSLLAAWRRVLDRYPTLETLPLGTTFRLRNRSCGAKIPLLNAGYIEHVNTMGDRTTVR